jgi:hypothetical protein
MMGRRVDRALGGGSDRARNIVVGKVVFTKVGPRPLVMEALVRALVMTTVGSFTGHCQQAMHGKDSREAVEGGKVMTREQNKCNWMGTCEKMMGNSVQRSETKAEQQQQMDQSAIAMGEAEHKELDGWRVQTCCDECGSLDSGENHQHCIDAHLNA